MKTIVFYFEICLVILLVMGIESMFTMTWMFGFIIAMLGGLYLWVNMHNAPEKDIYSILKADALKNWLHIDITEE